MANRSNRSSSRIASRTIENQNDTLTLHFDGIPPIIAFDCRSERQMKELTDNIADAAWGLIKQWQQADDNRKQTDYQSVVQATETYLCRIGYHRDSAQLVTDGILDVLTTLGREKAKIYLQ